MRTYIDDEYDYMHDLDETISFGGFKRNYESPEYSIWLEDFLFRMLMHCGHKSEADVKDLFHEIGCEYDTYLEDLCKIVEDKKKRENDPLLENYPLNLIDHTSRTDEETRSVNEWEIHLVAQIAKETLDKTGGNVKSDDYNEMLEKLYPYEKYFLKQTWGRLDESMISKYFSVRIDPDIEWYDCTPEDIVYDLKFLISATEKEDRYLSIDANLHNTYWENLSLQG